MTSNQKIVIYFCRIVLGCSILFLFLLSEAGLAQRDRLFEDLLSDYKKYIKREKDLEL